MRVYTVNQERFTSSRLQQVFVESANDFEIPEKIQNVPYYFTSTAEYLTLH